MDADEDEQNRTKQNKKEQYKKNGTEQNRKFMSVFSDFQDEQKIAYCNSQVSLWCPWVVLKASFERLWGVWGVLGASLGRPCEVLVTFFRRYQGTIVCSLAFFEVIWVFLVVLWAFFGVLEAFLGILRLGFCNLWTLQGILDQSLTFLAILGL